MYIRETIGRYAGEIRDFAPHVARELIHMGRAVNPFDESGRSGLVARTIEKSDVKAEAAQRKKRPR